MARWIDVLFHLDVFRVGSKQEALTWYMPDEVSHIFPRTYH